METDLAGMPEKKAVSSQDFPLCQEKNTENEEVAAMRLTARSQGFQFPNLRIIIWTVEKNH
uniref:Zinc finger protein 286A n=1 Tax=Sciurus vulgaris TaxID=55149 RepID=A0A8D2JHX6_SCIVU